MAEPAIHISKIASETLHVPIVGTTPLIVSRFSEKAKRKILDAQQGRRSPREARDPQAEYLASLYRLGEGYGFPAVGFKAATVGAARFYGKDVKMTELRQFLWFAGQMAENTGSALVPIVGEPKMREDSSGWQAHHAPPTSATAVSFTDWSATLIITYVTSSFSQSSVLSLIDAGGMGVGVGEWRPERKGDFGTYRVDEDAEVLVNPKASELAEAVKFFSLRDELLRVRAEHGELTATTMVMTATPVDDPLHHHFEWDDRVAGHEHRLTQAANLIRSVKIRFTRPSGESGTVRGLIRDPHQSKPVYNPTEEVLADPAAREIMLAQMRREWASFKARYEMFNEFADLIRREVEGGEVA